MFDVGKRINELRKSKNIKSVVLAQACGFTQGFLSSLENNNKKCSIENLEKICDALDVSLSEFFSTEPSRLTSQEYALLDSVKGFTPEQLDKFIAFAESVGRS